MRVWVSYYNFQFNHGLVIEIACKRVFEKQSTKILILVIVLIFLQ